MEARFASGAARPDEAAQPDEAKARDPAEELQDEAVRDVDRGSSADEDAAGHDPAGHEDPTS